MKRICSKCHHSIRRCERFHRVKSRFLGFLWAVERTEHWSCLHPSTGPSVKRLRGEVPLPFPEPDLMNAVSLMAPYEYKNNITSTSPRDELANLN